MSVSTINKSQHEAAKAAGLAYLITFATVVYVNFGIHRFGDNAAETARNILANERLFRVGLVGDLITAQALLYFLQRFM